MNSVVNHNILLLILYFKPISVKKSKQKYTLNKLLVVET